MPVLIQQGHKQEGRLPAFEWSRKMGHFRRQMVAIYKMLSRWESVKSPADSSKVQSPLLLQRKCWLLQDRLSMVWGVFYLYELNGAGLFFWKISAPIYVDVQKSSTGFENWVMYVSMLLVSPQFDLQLPAAVGGTNLVAMSMLSLYHSRPDSSVASRKDFNLCIPCDPINSFVLHRVHKQLYNLSKHSRSGTLTVQIKIWSRTSCTERC